MIDSIKTYSTYAINAITPKIPTLSGLVNKIALGALIALSAVLFYLHHNLFAFGFVVGFIRNNDIRDLVEKVDGVFKYCAKRSYLEQGCIYFVSGFIALWAMPISLVTATLYYSAQWGARLAFTSKAQAQATAQAQAQPTPPAPAVQKTHTQAAG